MCTHCRIKMLTPDSLMVDKVGRNDKGIYQCLVTNKRNSAQSMAELKLGGKQFCMFFSYFILYVYTYTFYVLWHKKKKNQLSIYTLSVYNTRDCV